MELVRIRSEEHERFPEAAALYSASFPVHERRVPASQRDALGDEEYHYDLIMDGDIFLGLLLCWETARFIYAEHFCVTPERRGNNYGSRALALLSRKGKSVILEIDPPIDEISLRRKAFYERAGYYANGFEHIHPPYRSGYAGHRLVVMSNPAPLTADEYKSFSRYLKERVMKNHPYPDVAV
ncbi:MAG: N-acetyltransferase [bacterium]|nr:N-acetyltransferase [bacterium]